MNELGRLEDLPEDYRAALTEKNLVPLWPSLRAVLPPGKPAIRTQPTCWPYQGLRPLLLRAGELTPIEKAERRVLVLANPGHGLDKLVATFDHLPRHAVMLQPGEVAPNHRHTPTAVRFVIEGEGGYTTVNGEKCPMHKGDLILTPALNWHEHGHEGSGPWCGWTRWTCPSSTTWKPPTPSRAPRRWWARSWTRRRTIPARRPAALCLAGPGAAPAPTRIRFPWARRAPGAGRIAASRRLHEAVQLAYVNPETGHPACRHPGLFGAAAARRGRNLRRAALGQQRDSTRSRAASRKSTASP
jgi:gentisate 1,2-dioxygenase